LFEDYYWDELLVVMEEYGIIHQVEDESVEEVDATEFLGGDGEWM
jgi:hypothetical protein